MTIKRNGSAVWSGGLKDGKGAVSTGSGVLKDSQYGFNTRFEDGPGTNPEELIGAAHAGCFTMALSGQLGQAGMTAQELRTTATVSMEKVEGGFSITAVHLDLVAKIPGARVPRWHRIGYRSQPTSMPWSPRCGHRTQPGTMPANSPWAVFRSASFSGSTGLRCMS